jgi:hypothetical protein
MLCMFKKLDTGQSLHMKIISVNSNHALSSVLFTHDTLAMKALVWLCVVCFRAIWFVHFGSALHMRI